MAGFGKIIKEELLRNQIKAPCCKSSFVCGVDVFAKSRKNEMTDVIEEYKARLMRVKKKKNTFFDDEVALGYLVGEKNGKKVPLSSGKICPFCSAHLMRGAFLSCGRASASGGDVHIEMALPNEECADMMTEMLEEIEIPPKRTVRRGELLLYYKKHETASDFLAYIGAVTMSFNMMQDFILNQRRSRAIRMTNCDSKNISKSVIAAGEQIKAIDAIIKHGAFDEMPVTLRETAMLRYENPSESLESLADMHESGLSRSGVNHRLTKIMDFAKKKGYILD